MRDGRTDRQTGNSDFMGPSAVPKKQQKATNTLTNKNYCS